MCKRNLNIYMYIQYLFSLAASIAPSRPIGKDSKWKHVKSNIIAPPRLRTITVRKWNHHWCQLSKGILSLAVLAHFRRKKKNLPQCLEFLNAKWWFHGTACHHSRISYTEISTGQDKLARGLADFNPPSQQTVVCPWRIGVSQNTRIGWPLARRALSFVNIIFHFHYAFTCYWQPETLAPGGLVLLLFRGIPKWR